MSRDRRTDTGPRICRQCKRPRGRSSLSLCRTCYHGRGSKPPARCSVCEGPRGRNSASLCRACHLYIMREAYMEHKRALATVRRLNQLRQRASSGLSLFPERRGNGY